VIIGPAAWTHPPVMAQGEPGMLKQLFYRGPSIDVLHEKYAKKGRIDARAPVGAAHEIRIEAPVGRVWELLVDVAAWGTWDRAVHDVHLDSTVAADARFTWVNGHARIRSRFAVVDPGRELTWTGVSTGAKAVDRHVLEATGGAATPRPLRGVDGRAAAGVVLQQRQAADRNGAVADCAQDGRGAVMIGQAFHWVNLTVAFLLELCALAALGIGAPLLAAVLWGLFAAPHAPVSIPLGSGGVQLLVFGSAAAALYATGRHPLALTFAVLVIANVVLVSL
jgi:hypothetical protein